MKDFCDLNTGCYYLDFGKYREYAFNFSDARDLQDKLFEIFYFKKIKNPKSCVSVLKRASKERDILF